MKKHPIGTSIRLLRLRQRGGRDYRLEADGTLSLDLGPLHYDGPMVYEFTSDETPEEIVLPNGDVAHTPVTGRLILRARTPEDDLWPQQHPLPPPPSG